VIILKRPNIIIFNPDQMRADSLGHLGNPACPTPFLDEFAKTAAVSFSNAYCQNPVCVPSRCSFTTGLYPHTRGHRTMSYLLREGESSIFRELKDAGYYVWMNARNDLVAGQIPGLLKHHANKIFYGGDCPENPSPEENIRGGMDSKHFYSFYSGKLGLDENGRNYGSDDEDVDAAIRCIQDKADDKPLCIFLGLINPHPPYQVEDPYFSAIDHDLLPSRVKADTDQGKPKIESLIREKQHLNELEEADWNEIRATYLGMCMKTDAMFARLVSALKEAGEYDNSAIFFFSDHGDYTGDHGIAEKAQNCFEDCLTHVPFLIKPPKNVDMKPGVANGMVELVDFYATAMELASVNPNHTHFGNSLVPAMSNHDVLLRDYVCCEGGRLKEEIHCDEFHDSGHEGIHPFNPYWPRLSAQVDDVAHGKGTMIRTKDYKYVSRLYEEDELYDLTADPEEHINRIHDPALLSVAVDMQYKLMKWYQRNTDVVPFDFDNRVNEDIVWAKIKRWVPAELEEEFRERIRKGANQYELVIECRQRFGREAINENCFS
jgi:arylsulfatase A-like enzyme